jgi:hypothetical protein
MVPTEAIIVVLVICALIGMAVGSNKGRGGVGFVLGGLFGIIGIIIVAVMSPAGSGAPAAAAPSAAPGWWPDPYGRHEQRYYTGTEWSGYVSDGGVQSVDAPTRDVPPGSQQ